MSKFNPTLNNIYIYIHSQSRRQRSTDEGATEVTKEGDDVAQSKNK